MTSNDIVGVFIQTKVVVVSCESSEPTEKVCSAAPTVKSAQRAIEILELFDRVQQPLSLTEIARLLQYPVPSTLALLKCLQGLEYVAYDPVAKTYAPTLRVCMLGDWLHGPMLQNGAVIALMNDLQSQTGETIVLAMQNDIFAQYVHTVQSRRALRYFLRPGSLRPIHRSATGKMLLAQMSDSVVQRMIRRVNLQATSDLKIADDQALIREIVQIRAQGFAYNDQWTEGVAALSVPLPVPAGMWPATVGVGGPVTRIQPKSEQIVALMRTLIDQHIDVQSGTRPSRLPL